MKSKLTKELFAEAWARGVPLKDITKAMRISIRTAIYWRKALGLPGREPFTGNFKEEKPND